MITYKVLSTKKISPSLITKAKQNNIEIIEQEFISIKPILTKEKYEQVMPIVSNTKVSNVVFTSANAVEAIKKYLHQGATFFVPNNWKIFCMAGKTKDFLKPNFKENQIIATAENASALAQKIIEHGTKEIVFFCGNKRRDELPEILKSAKINVEEIIVYETIETPVISTKYFDGILFFSPSAIKSFFSANQLNKKSICFALGKTTAYAIKEYTNNKIIISELPREEMMLAAVNFYFQNINCYE
jgi:uroporphyrinogen-III synthase